jgi:acetyl esterase
MKHSQDSLPTGGAIALDHQRLSGLDSASRALMREAEGQIGPEAIPIEEARRRMRDGQQTTFDDANLFHESVKCANCTVDVVRRCDLLGPAPIVFFLHGGGWVMGDANTHGYLVSQLALRSGCAIAFINYPLAPELRYPKILDDTHAAIQELLAIGARHQLDPSRFALAGDSAGGNLAVALTLRLKKENLPAPQLQILLYPALDISAKSTSYQTFSHGLNLTRQTMHWFWDQYAPGMRACADTLLSPLLATEAQLFGAPTTLIITSEFDVLCDEGELFAKRLQSANVSASHVRFGGVLHGFMVTEPLAKSQSGELAIQMVSDFLRRNLVRTSQDQ